MKAVSDQCSYIVDVTGNKVLIVSRWYVTSEVLKGKSQACFCVYSGN